MKRTYEVARADVMRNHLALRVIVSDLGASWFFDLKIPFDSLDTRALYEAGALEDERRMRWESRQRERLDDSLF